MTRAPDLPPLSHRPTPGCQSLQHQRCVIAQMSGDAVLIRRPGADGYRTRIWLESPRHDYPVYSDAFRALKIKGFIRLKEIREIYGVVEFYELTDAGLAAI